MSDWWISSRFRAILSFMGLRELITSFETMNFIDDKFEHDLTQLRLIYNKRYLSIQLQ